MQTLRHGARARRLATTALVATSALVLAACGGQDGSASGGGDQALAGQVRVDGSSTVAPLTSAAAELFKAEVPNVNVTVATSGTGGGFKAFCAGTTDISNASRPIKDDEKKACADANIQFTELVVANDALTVVTNPQNAWATCLTVEQLATMWAPGSEGKINNWNQVDPAFPNVPLKLFGPGTDSGTFDYFTDEVNGEEGASRTDYSASEDDNVLVQGVSGDQGATGYFGYTYFEENQAKLKAVQVDGGKGCVAPSAATVQDGTYVPLARPLYIYVNKAAFARPEVAAFVEFYTSKDSEIAEAAQFVALNAEQQAKLQQAVGTLG